jgi:hypothetical protein
LRYAVWSEVGVSMDGCCKSNECAKGSHQASVYGVGLKTQ